MLKMYHSVLMSGFIDPHREILSSLSTGPGSSEVRVSDTPVPLQLTWIQGLARKHLSRADACQHGHRVWVIQRKYSLPDPEVRGFQAEGSLTHPEESPVK